MAGENEFIEFNEDGLTFVLSQYKVSLIYKYVADLKEYWSLPIENFGEYRIQPSNRSNEWRVNKILGYKLRYILNHVSEINQQLDTKYRLNGPTLREIEEQIKEISFVSESTEETQTEIELYTWQEEALNTWYFDEGKRGIVEAATGTGKTRLAFACMRKYFEDYPEGIVCIVVPRQPLFDQWQEELHGHFPDISENHYCYNGNGHADSINKATQVIITTQQAMVLKEDSRYGCTLLKKLCQSGRDVLIVFDEAHHLGAIQTIDRFVKYIPNKFYTLGLTATPIRTDGTMDEVYPYFDSEESRGPIYSYPISKAVEDGVLCKVLQNNFTVSLSEQESQAHQRFCEQIKEIKKRIVNNTTMRVDKDKINRGNIAYLLEIRRKLLKLQEQNSDLSQEAWDLIKKIDMLNTLYINRRRLFNKAEQKWELLNSLLSKRYWIQLFSNGRWIFFHQEIKECKKTADLLKNALGEEKVRLHYSEMAADERQNVLLEFDKNKFNCLCAVQTLDEGLDIPELKGIVIVSGSASRRQQIQRCGRALRNAPNKEWAYLVIFLAQVDDDLTGEKLLIGPDTSTDRWVIKETTY